MKTVCCLCNKAESHQGWEEQLVQSDVLSHGYCPECFERAMAQMKKEINGKPFLKRLARNNFTR